jgi:amino acid permease
VLSSLLILSIILTTYSAYSNVARWFYLVNGIYLFAMLVFIATTGIVVLRRLHNSGKQLSGRKERQRRMAIQLICVCVIEFLAIVALNVLAFLPEDSFSSFNKFYFGTVFFPGIVRC